MTQLSFSLSDQVAPLFSRPIIKDYCTLIDEKVAQGKVYHDLKGQLLHLIRQSVDLTQPRFQEAYDFVKNY
jgi:hypothetical protein